jgi:hypothetical protein
MTALIPMVRTGALTRRDPRRLDLFRKTVGKDLRGDEIDEAIEWCELYGANPFVKDIYFFVFDADKRTSAALFRSSGSVSIERSRRGRATIGRMRRRLASSMTRL